MSSNFTIIALSTPPGLGALAIIRLSGPRALDILYHLTRSSIKLSPRVAHNLNIFEGNDVLDNAIIIFYKEPASYTGEDLVEISCHGSPFIINKIIELCTKKGAALAQPGEFTRRAFINGKIDLTQAEAVADLVFSQTQSAHKAAMHLLEGDVGREIETLRKDLIDLISILELELDFADNEIDPLPISDQIIMLDKILKINNFLLNSYSCGKIIKQGALVPIIGPPNSGKSSLLNALLNEERAIVTPYPGTTRDSLEETVQTGGYLLRLLDTAGIRKTKNPIEKLGINRTKDCINKGDIVLFVVDVTGPIKRDWSNYYKRENVITVINKIDIASKEEITRYDMHFKRHPHVQISAKNRIGIDNIKSIIAKMLSLKTGSSDSLIITNQRQAQNLRVARSYLLNAKKHLNYNLSPEIIIADLRQALGEYDKILGKTSTEEILNNIFQNFCIGK